MTEQTEHQDETKAAYDEVVELYASLFADRMETQPFARNMIATFAELVRGTGNLRTADVGCGPGHLTAMLHELGLDAFGIDLSPGMVDHARRAHPELRFEEARMEVLPVEDGALGGVLAHYSMIHTPPEELPAVLAEQVRVLAPGGLLLVSFFGTGSVAGSGSGSGVGGGSGSGSRKGGGGVPGTDRAQPVRFDHKVTPAWAWPADRFAELLTGAGLVDYARLVHDPASERGFLDCHLLARRP
ncbi:class I SAM-dependent methyltransferase [Streptomyces fragilis]|uniref:Class I SAM-dependent methyltransferase n=1 Tax=Streptomyces fragilis TaxID=67301 RepID=A0ABV2YDJ9_9ACTN|nr:class I SAM-dependent methyltransferase [Streptomyces fragilis]